MSSKKSKKRQKDEYVPPGEREVEKPTKEEIAVAKWMKSNVPIKKTKFLNHNVEYFSAIKALDALMASKFAQGDHPLFPHRTAAIDFLGSMLVHKMFHRARKVPVTEQELRSKKPVKATKEQSKEEGKSDADSSHAEGKSSESKEKLEKRKRKIRLDMHPEQLFIDGHEAYVWIYDPIPMHYWIFGALVVFGAIVICLFPLWPPTLRKGVYYLSVAAAGFLVFILGLAVVRFIIFCIVWLFTGGKHHFWIFPNLTEDVGFLASFQPLYQHEYRGDGKDGAKKGKKRKKDKDSDAEEEKPLLEQDEEDEEVERPVDDVDSDEKPDPEPESAPAEGENRSASASESESESSSQKSSTGKDFELIDAHEAETIK